jgi:hypothetical protein
MNSVSDPLPSWQEGKIKQRILEFVEQVTDPKSSHFVVEEERIATFDNDGTLWVEKPLLAQVAFYKRELLDADVLAHAGIVKRTFNWGLKSFRHLSGLTKMLLDYFRSGLTTDEYREKVAQWIAQAQHPRYKRKYTDLVYQPMQEVMELFSLNGFTNYIVSGGSANFIRPWADDIYNVPEDRIIGSSTKTRLAKRDGELAVKLEPLPFSFEYRSGKVLGIERRLAKRPIAAFGNSLGDVEMLRWARTTRQSLCVLIHHTDDVREYKYDPDPKFHIGKSTLTFAQELGWQVVDMKKDWRSIFAFENSIQNKEN